MKTINVVVLTIIVAFIITMCNGCGLLENAASDVSGWDVSACVSGIDTCWELFVDNADKFEDGFVEAMGNLP